MISDPVADMLTRIRNARARKSEKVSMPASKIKSEVARVLKQEGYINDYKTVKVDKVKSNMTVYLKYNNYGECAINKLVRVSKSGRRIYRGVDNFGKVLDGLGITIVSTSKGVMSDKECKKLNLGGEVFCYIY